MLKRQREVLEKPYALDTVRTYYDEPEEDRFYTIRHYYLNANGDVLNDFFSERISGKDIAQKLVDDLNKHFGV